MGGRANGGGEGEGGEWFGRRRFQGGEEGKGRHIRLEWKVIIQVLCHGGIAKEEGGFGEDFRWMVLGGKEVGGGVVVDFVVG